MTHQPDRMELQTMLSETSPTGSRRWSTLWRSTLATAVLVTLALADVALAGRACLEPKEETGRTCSEEVCLSLQAAVNDHCKNQQIFKCTRLTQCAALQEMRRRWINCGSARNTINATCWRGGDPNHQQKANEAWQNVSLCNVRIVEYCNDPCPWDSSRELQTPGAVPDAGQILAAEEMTVDLLVSVLERLAAEGRLEAVIKEESDDAGKERED